jgi:hypothetical protein|tara:strand:+ start:599 stop:772 length:174 start_codon:yes stop_codon:yes gene_type:complete
MKILGIAMLAAPFIGLFFYLTYIIGFAITLFIFALAAFFIYWVTVAIDLIHGPLEDS